MRSIEEMSVYDLGWLTLANAGSRERLSSWDEQKIMGRGYTFFMLHNGCMEFINLQMKIEWRKWKYLKLVLRDENVYKFDLERAVDKDF